MLSINKLNIKGYRLLDQIKIIKIYKRFLDIYIDRD